MKEYKIEVEEISQKIVEIEAETLEEAISIARKQWYDGKILLDNDDFKQVNVREFK